MDLMQLKQTHYTAEADLELLIFLLYLPSVGTVGVHHLAHLYIYLCNQQSLELIAGMTSTSHRLSHFPRSI